MCRLWRGAAVRCRNYAALQKQKSRRDISCRFRSKFRCYGNDHVSRNRQTTEQWHPGCHAHVQANIQVSPLSARGLVSVYVGNEIADLLHGDIPDLVIRADGAYWRVPVVLSSPTHGSLGVVGAVDVNVETGTLQMSNAERSEIERHAERLAASTLL